MFGACLKEAFARCGGDKWAVQKALAAASASVILCGASPGESRVCRAAGGGDVCFACGWLCVAAQAGALGVDFGGVRLMSSVNLSPGRWYHVAVTKAKVARKSASTVLYLDGAAVPLTVSNYGGVSDVDSRPSSFTSPSSLMVGQGVVYDQPTTVRSTAFVGYIDDVRLAPSVFAAATVARAYELSRPDHLIDMVVRLDGTGEYVQLPNVNIGGSAVTVQAWVYARDPLRPAQTIMDLSDSTATNVLSLSFGAGGVLVYTVDNRPTAGAVRQTLVSPLAFPRARWTHVAVVHDGTSVSMLWDGEPLVRGVVWCGVVWYGVVWCGVVWLGSGRV